MIFLPACFCLSGFETELKPFPMQFTKDDGKLGRNSKAVLGLASTGCCRARARGASTSVFGSPLDFGLRISDLGKGRPVVLTSPLAIIHAESLLTEWAGIAILRTEAKRLDTRPTRCAWCFIFGHISSWP